MQLDAIVFNIFFMIKMTDCRVCLSRDPEDTLIAPCKCKGSINLVHKSCLDNWLKMKYTHHFDLFRKKLRSGPTGLQCELCKYEFLGQFKLGSLSFIVRSIKESKLASSIMINIIVVAAITYKLKALAQSFPSLYKAFVDSVQTKGVGQLLRLVHSIKLLGNVSSIGAYWFINIVLIYGTVKMVSIIMKKIYRLEIASID